MNPRHTTTCECGNCEACKITAVHFFDSPTRLIQWVEESEVVGDYPMVLMTYSHTIVEIFRGADGDYYMQGYREIRADEWSSEVEPFNVHLDDVEEALASRGDSSNWPLVVICAPDRIGELQRHSTHSWRATSERLRDEYGMDAMRAWWKTGELPEDGGQ